MCEIFGVCLSKKIKLNEYLREFFSHSSKHPHGWGMGILNKNHVSIEKEPESANKSHYLRERLREPITEKNMLAHIRYATIGNVEYKNCHPYSIKDKRGRRWTMIHNGTIFDYDPLNKYVHTQNGDTDSERILMYITDRINLKEKAGLLSSSQRFELLDEIIADMSKGNKLNLILYDGEIMYVHTNYVNSLYYLEKEEGFIISTTPLSNDEWKKVPFMTLISLKDGKVMQKGKCHGNEYIEDQNNIKYLYQIFSYL